jgi:hypothetical protein
MRKQHWKLYISKITIQYLAMTITSMQIENQVKWRQQLLRSLQCVDIEYIIYVKNYYIIYVHFHILQRM